jgi:hypothetical protein
MKPATRFRCPACGFAVFNRRLPACESCGAGLPSELLYTPQQLQALAAAHQRIDLQRDELARQAAELEAQRLRRRGDGG